MKHIYIILTLCLGCCQIPAAQRFFQSGDEVVELLEFVSFPEGLSYRDPVGADDPESVKLFKNYFNPVSLEAYLSYFLPQERPAATIEKFNKWQDHLKGNKMWLETILHVKTPDNNEFIIYQYTFESKEYILPNSAVFKKINNTWKHISLVNDRLAPFLKDIGALNTSFLTGLPRDQFHVNTISVLQTHKRSSTEKFDREMLFGKSKMYWEMKSVPESTLIYAKELFLKGEEVEMVNYIAESYQLDAYTLMGDLNALFGFPMFKFISPGKSN